MSSKIKCVFENGDIARYGGGAPGQRGREKTYTGCIREPRDGYKFIAETDNAYAPINPVKVAKPKGIMYTQLANGSLVKDGPALVAEPQGYIKIAAEAKFGKGVNTIKVKKGDWIRLEKTA